jgi:hypothetical protein
VVFALASGGLASCERVLFVTSNRWSGNLGGLAGADKACNDAAASGRSVNVRGRTYKAWLSNGASSAFVRLTHGTSRYVSTTGRLIANDFNDLSSSGFKAPPTDENGDPSGGNVWTATLANGSYTPSASSCTQWTDGTAQMKGVVGLADATDATTWTVSGQLPCDTLGHLYCLED